MYQHFTAEEVVEGDFLFVSYRHTDKEIVTNGIDALLGDGIRLWYDADLCISDEWNERAERLIKHEKCKGVIFFNSISSFQSANVAMEREFALKKYKACKTDGTPFAIFPVNIGEPSTMRLLKKIFAALPEDDEEIERKFPLSSVRTIAELFKANTIYCYVNPKEPTAYLDELYEAISKVLPTVVSEESRKLKGGGGGKLTLGTCIDKADDALPAFLLGEDGAIEHRGESYIVSNGVGYTVKPLSWRLLFTDGSDAVLLAESNVDIRNGGSDLEEWIKTVFPKISFSEDERKNITSVALLTPDDISRVKDASLFAFTAQGDTTGYWWIAAKGVGALQKVMREDGTVYNTGYNFRIKKVGVRPVIRIKKDVFSKLVK